MNPLIGTLPQDVPVFFARAGIYFVTPNLSVPCNMKPVGPPQQVVVSDAATVNVTLTADFGKGSAAGGRMKK